MASIPSRRSEANSAGHPAACSSDQKQRDWVRAARRLRQVRLASRQFLFLWMLQGQHRAAARTGVSMTGNAHAQFPPSKTLSPDTGWSALYVGDVLDD
jgi:hypothetical protein